MLLGISVFVLTVALIVCVVLLVMCNQNPPCIKLDASKEFEKDFKELNLKVNADSKVVYKQNEYLINFVYSDDKLKKLFENVLSYVECIINKPPTSEVKCTLDEKLTKATNKEKEILFTLSTGIIQTIMNLTP